MAEKYSVNHTHSADERMTGAELRDHLRDFHGWSSGMLRKRGDIEGGRYALAWHENAHKTAHLDNPKGS